MTAVAGLAIVLISRYALMVAVSISPVMLMAVNAFEYREVAEVDMAVGTGAPTPPMRPGIDWEILGIVNPGGWNPGGCRMAGLALKWESNLAVVGVCRTLVIRLMATVAVGGSVIVTGCVALLACRRQMSARQRELGVAVVKCSRIPGRCRMALAANMAKVILDMIRIHHPIEIRLMARIAVVRGILVTVGMTGDTGKWDMCSG